MKTKMRNPRGYLLIDIMIGGALAAIVITGILTVLANARARNTNAARDVIASQLVLERIDQVRSQAFATINSTPDENPVTGANIRGNYRRRTQVSTTGSPENVGGFSLPFKDVTVTVTYTTGAVTGATTRTTQATTRVYQ